MGIESIVFVRGCGDKPGSGYNPGTMDIDLNQLPIPDWGLTCPGCRYPLRGLPSHRCPECGTAFEIAELVRPWTRLRPPHYTGHEEPLPDFGLDCAACGAPLAGATGQTCGTCGQPFDPEAVRPRQEWFVLDAGLCGDLPLPAVQALLAAELVPHVTANEKTVREVYGGHGPLHDRLRVPREFFFDILWLLQHERQALADVRAGTPGPEWTCPGCGEENPAHFQICWNCEQERRAETPDDLSSQS